MTSLLNRGAAWLRDKAIDTAVAGESITYTRGAHFVTLSAIVGRTPFRTVDPGNGRVQLTRSDADFLIDPTLLVLNGVQVEPQRGDVIARGGQTFEPQSINGEPCWRNADQYGKLIRIHTMRVD